MTKRFNKDGSLKKINKDGSVSARGRKEDNHTSSGHDCRMRYNEEIGLPKMPKAKGITPISLSDEEIQELTEGFDDTLFTCNFPDTKRQIVKQGILRQVKIALLYIKLGYPTTKAVAEVGLNGSIFYAWVNANDRNKEMFEQCKEYRVNNVIETLYELAMKEGRSQLDAVKYYLQHNSDRYTSKDVNNVLNITLKGKELESEVNTIFGLDSGDIIDV